MPRGPLAGEEGAAERGTKGRKEKKKDEEEEAKKRAGFRSFPPRPLSLSLSHFQPTLGFTQLALPPIPHVTSFEESETQKSRGRRMKKKKGRGKRCSISLKVLLLLLFFCSVFF